LTSCPSYQKQVSTIPIPKQIQKEITYSTVTPPWKVWGYGEVKHQEINYIEELERKGQLQEAFERYQIVERTTTNPLTRDLALLYKLNVALKMGKSVEVLNELVAYVKIRNIEETKIPTKLILLAIYSYYHQNRLEQCFAWLNLLAKNTEGVNQKMFSTAQRTGRMLVGTLPADKFQDYKKHWGQLSFFVPFFKEEEYRRLKNNQPKVIKTNWFNAAVYQPTISEDEIKPAESLPEYSNRKISALPDFTIAAVLPLTGRYKEHGKRVRNGIDLAMEQYFAGTGHIPDVAYVDSAIYDMELTREVTTTDLDGNEVVEIETIPRPELEIPLASKVILGPMDIKANELLVKEPQLLGKPFISFTKKEGITEVDSSCFRLGVTASNQISELVAYATVALGYKNFSVFYPDNETGRELANLFNTYVTAMDGEVISSNAYKVKNVSSMRSAFVKADGNLGEAVFIADAPDDTKSLISNIKKLQPEIVFLGTALWNDKAIISALGAELEGSIFVTPFYYWSEQRQVKDFIQAYVWKYGSEPDILSAQAYDATNLVLNMFADNRSAYHNFLDALRSAKTMQGITGLLQVYPNKEINRRMTVLQVRDGEAREVMVSGKRIPVAPTATDNSY
jgi:branched-chain amino acid transport system substrate-binding protein